MTRRRIASIAALMALALPAVVLAGASAYTSPTLNVSYAGSTTVITASTSDSDDATAVATIYVPTGTTITSTQAPGTQIGNVTAQVSSLKLAGKIIVARPGAIGAGIQLQCIQEATPLSTWIMQLTSVGGVPIHLPAYLLPTAGAESGLGPAKLRICIAPPVVSDQNTFSAKFLSTTLALTGVFGPVAQGAWIAFWTPWAADNSIPDQTATVASPAAVAVGAVTIKARKAGLGAVVSGKVTQGGLGRPAAVSIWGAKGTAALRKLATVKTTTAGNYTFRPRTGDVFQARVVAPSMPAPPLCQLISAQLQGIPCINPTANGFTIRSAAVHKK